MNVEHHDLHHDFPDMADQIRELKMSDRHFARLFDEYHELADMDGSGQGNWQQLDRDLMDLNNDLYGAN